MESQKKLVISVAMVAIVLLGSTVYVLQKNKTLAPVESVVIDTADLNQVENVQEEVVTSIEENVVEPVEQTEEKKKTSYVLTPPAGLVMSEGGRKFFPSNLKRDENYGLLSGYIIVISSFSIPDGDEWRGWVGLGTDGLGPIEQGWSEERVIGDHFVIEFASVGRGMMDVFTESHTDATYAFTNKAEDTVVEINLFAQTDEVKQYIPVVEEMIKSFKWEE